MAYNLSERKPIDIEKCGPLLEPGMYQFDTRTIKQNKAPFLSKTPRKPIGVILYTQADYEPKFEYKIPNITSLKDKTKRFPYEALSADDLEEILCKCGIASPCACLPEPEKEIVCQGKVKRSIFKGPPPRPPKPKRKSEHHDPPFYDSRLNESTKFYQGCKWSHWTAKRVPTSAFEVRPGPADYDIEKEPTQEQKCYEYVRAHKRKTSKQLRFIEIIQNQNILDKRPGPASYSPEEPKGTDLKFLGSKAIRFSDSQHQLPGPSDYKIKRDFEPPKIPKKPCHATLPSPAAFGVNARRFPPRKEEGPSPASYDANCRPCHFMHCPTAPFNTSAVRFKDDIKNEEEREDTCEKELDHIIVCPQPTWGFKSKTIRIKPLEKKLDEASPADLPQSTIKVSRSEELQVIAPFNSSNGRFEPWYDYLPMHGSVKTPGPCYYNLELPKCVPAVNRGPLYRAKRFSALGNSNPAPNEYNIGSSIRNVLKTFNRRLSKNVDKISTKFDWQPPGEVRIMDEDELSEMLIQKCIDLLEPEPV